MKTKSFSAKYEITVAALLLHTLCNSQALCPNIDFESGTFTNWTAQTGTCCPINTLPSNIIFGRHTIMSGTARDPFTCYTVPVVCPSGGNFSARLGNSNVGAEAERLIYPLYVSPQSLFIYRYAVVLEDPSHTPAAQPRFQIRILDAAGNLVDPVCGFYSVVASANIPGFQSCGDIRYKNWTTVGLDLSAYAGQMIQIEFSTGDCDYGGHFGYAYIDGECSSMQISSNYCANSNTPAVLTAPTGFTYLWNTGETTQSISIVNPQPGTVYSVVLTSVTGCQVTLTTQMIATIVQSGFNVANYCNKNVVFKDATQVINGTAVAWYWDFGDGLFSTDRNPVHRYAKDGSYTVSLTTTTSEGCSDTYSRTVNLIPSPNADFIFGDLCIGKQAWFKSTSFVEGGSITGCNWSFISGEVQDDCEARYYISHASVFTVSLVAEGSNGCTDTIHKEIRVLEDPVAEFEVDRYSGCEPLEVAFNNLSLKNGCDTLFNFWTFDDGSISSEPNPIHTFNQAGTYFPILTVTNEHQCSASKNLNIPVEVFPKPVAAFTVDPPEATLFNSVFSFTNYSLKSETWLWDFGDLTSEYGFAATHRYAQAGNFPVTLVAFNSYACSDTAEQEVAVIPELSFYVPAAFTPNGDGLNDLFRVSSLDFSDFHLMIFNRWGEKIFECNHPDESWNGQIHGLPSAMGTYRWTARVRDLKGKVHSFSGALTLLR